MQNDEKKGITVKIDADLHAEVKAYLEQNSMTMAEFVTAALQDELHPKIELREDNKNMENMRTMAFQVPESLFMRIKDYLHRNGISQKQFVLGLIENELDREQTERLSEKQAVSPREEQDGDVAEEQDETPTEAIVEGGEGKCEEEEEDLDEDEDLEEELTEETTLTDENEYPEIEGDEDEEQTEDAPSEEDELSEEESQDFEMVM